MAVLRQRHSCRERRRFVRPVPELCLLQGVYPDEVQVCRAGLPASSHPAKRVFLVRDIAGEDRVPPGDQVSDRERAPVPDVSGSEGRGYGCWPALSVRHRSTMPGMPLSFLLPSIIRQRWHSARCRWFMMNCQNTCWPLK